MKLKQEKKLCMEELNCNIIVMECSKPKVLRLNLTCLTQMETHFISAAASPNSDRCEMQGQRLMHSTPVSSPTFSVASPVSISSFMVYEENPLFEGLHKGRYTPINNIADLVGFPSALDLVGESVTTPWASPPLSTVSTPNNLVDISQSHIIGSNGLSSSGTCNIYTKSSSSRSLLDSFIQFDQDIVGRYGEQEQAHRTHYMSSSRTRTATSVCKPPPLCSLCQHKAPVFEKPPIKFSYRELKEATDGFSVGNFLGEGGFGLVHKGVLKDGQVVAVKQLKIAGCQGDTDFCRELRVLSCAHHRNVVLLIGFCVEGKRRLLVYEYICNTSLDFHLHGNMSLLDWRARLRIGIGTARGLRYLHEDCRIGRIVHRDMRPSNILLTHDFEPLVSDFGLSRLHSEWDISAEERVVGSAGYLAPEYLDGGDFSEKVDVYAFGMVLLDLVMGQKEHTYMEKQILEKRFDLIRALGRRFSLAAGKDHISAPEKFDKFPLEFQVMSHAAYLCLNRDPELRPPMSKVLRVLEGDAGMPLGLDLRCIGNRSELPSICTPESLTEHPLKLSN